MRLNKTYMGTCSLEPTRDVTAGEFSTWTITFTAGEYGIDDGGTMVLAWKSVSDWDTPQFDAPTEPGYTTVTTTGHCNLRARYNKFYRSFGNSILIEVNGGYIQKGDVITVTLGDTSKGSLGMRAQSFCEREHEFRLYLDPCSTLRYEEMPERMKVRIVPAMHHEIQCVLPGGVYQDEPFAVAIRALDEFGNPTSRYQGRVKLEMICDEGFRFEGIPEEVDFDYAPNGVVRIEGCRVAAMPENPEACSWSIRISDAKQGYVAMSNGSICTRRGKGLRLFWGDMHGQTRQTVGTGLLEDYYSFARDKACIDFTGWQGNDFEVTQETWKDVRRFTKKFNEEGRFLAYLGYEWSGTTPQGGDYNVHFLGDNEQFYPSSNWSAPGEDPSLNANPASELHEKLAGRKDVMLVPHIGGRYANLDYFNYDFSSVIEIHSHHGTFEWFAFDAMKRRMKVGFIASSDDHICRPGLSYPLSGHGRSASGAFDVASGFTGVYAEDLTKQDIWDAIRARHCFASTFDRIALFTSVNGIGMGDEGEISADGKAALHVQSRGSFPIESITVYDWDQEVAHKDIMKRCDNSDSSLKKIRLRWSGVVYRGRGKSAKWDGFVYVRGGKIKTAEKYAFDRIDQGIVIKSDQYVKFTSSTSGDYDGLILEIEGDENTRICFSSARGDAEAPLSEILAAGFTKPMEGLNLKVEMEAAFDPIPQDAPAEIMNKAVSLNETIEVPAASGEHAYWVRVLQSNGNAAWASPVFVKAK